MVEATAAFGSDPIQDVEGFIARKLATARPGDTVSRVPPGFTPREAEWFGEAVADHGDEPALLRVTPEGKVRSDRCPRTKAGDHRAYSFVSENPTHDQETVVHWSAMGRFRFDFGWPREYLICESPRVMGTEGEILIAQDAVDILVLEAPCAVPEWRMSVSVMHSRVVGEVKRNSAEVEKLIQEMRVCQSACESNRSHDEHNKCRAIAALRPRFFLAVGAAETWRLFRVAELGGQAALADEVTPDLSDLRF
jgi:hypothetical protein